MAKIPNFDSFLGLYSHISVQINVIFGTWDLRSAPLCQISCVLKNPVLDGATENAENAEVENAGADSMGGKCRSGKCRSILQGWKM